MTRTASSIREHRTHFLSVPFTPSCENSVVALHAAFHTGCGWPTPPCGSSWVCLHSLPFPVCPLSVLWLVLVWALRRSHLNDGWLAITVIVMCGCLGLRSHLLPLALGPWKKTTSYSVPLWEFGCTKGFRAPSCCMEFIHTVLELQILTGVLFPGEKGRESKIP